MTQPHSHSAASLKALQPFGHTRVLCVITMSNSSKALLAKSASPQSVEPERSFSDASNSANAAAIVSQKSERCQNGKTRSFSSHAFTYLNYAFTGLDGPISSHCISQSFGLRRLQQSSHSSLPGIWFVWRFGIGATQLYTSDTSCTPPR